jgi:peptide/nickel transport system substrate-binding protein/oligopeptide transport system substrate-binding protein
MPAAYVVPRDYIEEVGSDFTTIPVGTGPFKILERIRDEKIVLGVNEKYFGNPPNIKGIIYRIIPEEITAMAEFEIGNLDVLSIPSAEFERFTHDPEFSGRIISGIGLNVYYIGLNCQRFPFNNHKLRQAINFAVNKEKILRTVLKGRGVLSIGPVPPTLTNYEKDWSAYPYNPEAVRRLLKEEGFEEGFAFKLYQKSSKEALRITEAIQDQLKDFNIHVKIVQLEWSSLKEAINRGEADAFYLAWVADYPDAENFLFPLFHSKNWGPGGNRVLFNNKRFDDLITEAQITFNDRRRYSLYKRCERLIVKKAPWVFLWHLKEFFVVQPWVKNYEYCSIYNADKGCKVELVGKEQ